MMIIMCHTLSYCIIVCPITFPHGPNCLDILCCAAGPCISASPWRRKSAVPLQPLEPLGPWRSISVVLTLATTEYDVLLVILNQNKSKSIIICNDCNDNITDMCIYIPYTYKYIYITLHNYNYAYIHNLSMRIVYLNADTQL